MSNRKLDFVAVGPFKTGTTWIYDYLLKYQQISLPMKVKETFFFDQKFDKGFDWYYSHFNQINSSKKVGEIAPSYFRSIEASHRIHELNPNCQIIVTLREPVSRLVSFYLHMKQRGKISPETSFKEAFAEKEIFQDTARYYFHLSRWIDIFGEDKVKVIFFEKLKNNPEEFAHEICEKLDLEVNDISPDLLSKKVNASQVPINKNLSNIVYSSVNLLHNLGLHKIVDYGKNLGIRQLLFSKRAEKFQLSEEEFGSIFELLKEDVLPLESNLNLDLSDWKQLWQAKGITID